MILQAQPTADFTPPSNSPHYKYHLHQPVTRASRKGKKMKPVCFLLHLLTSLLVFVNVFHASNGLGGVVGGWKPIKNLSDPHVLEIGQFAVSEHNKVSNSKLGFIRVIKGETQVVNGLNYRFVIEAKDGGKVGSYEAIVWEKPLEKFLKLTSFKPVKM